MAKTERKLAALPYAYDSISGLSKQVMEWHHDKHYAGYVNSWNTIQAKLETADRKNVNANWSDFGELKRRETFNANGAILHELYFANLGGNGAIDASSAIGQQIAKDFGSIDAWKEDFVATGKISLGWAVLCWDYTIGRLYNYAVDFHHYGAVFGCIPLLALDVFEHAYYRDYGPDRAKYIEAFMASVNWDSVNGRYSSVKK
ncbi:MAG TPA: superoxide dismutase [archaeon]|nr:superoxide dismutase [archaeon]